jgi:hypothetical protein
MTPKLSARSRSVTAPDGNITNVLTASTSTFASSTSSMPRSRGWVRTKRSKKMGNSQAARGIVQLGMEKGKSTMPSASQR